MNGTHWQSGVHLQDPRWRQLPVKKKILKKKKPEQECVRQKLYQKGNDSFLGRRGRGGGGGGGEVWGGGVGRGVGVGGGGWQG